MTLTAKLQHNYDTCPSTKSDPAQSTLHHKVLAVGALWDDHSGTTQTLRLAVARKRRPWFDGLWANAGEPVKLTPVGKIPNG